MVPFNMMVYLEDQDKYVPDDEVKNGDRVLNISGTELRQRLNEGREIPAWFTYPEVVTELRKSFPPRHKQGVTIFFTGLSGSGKSTIANVLLTKFLELVDVRSRFSMAISYASICLPNSASRRSTATSISVASDTSRRKSRRMAVSPFAPPSLRTDATRKHVRRMIEPYGGFILVHIATSVEVCEQRDRKGLYAKARAGILKEFTGISDPYEVPTDAEVTINTGELSPEEAAQEIILHLEREGFIGTTAQSA